MGAVPIFLCAGSFDSFARVAIIVSSLNRTSPQGPGTRCGIECARTVRFWPGPFSLSQSEPRRLAPQELLPVNFARRTRQRLALEVIVITNLGTALEGEGWCRVLWTLPKVSLADRPIGQSRESRAFFIFLAFWVTLALITPPSFAGTKIVHSWVLTGEPMPRVQKMLVIAILENYLIRQELEDEMEELLAKAGVTGIKSHMVLPPRNEVTEDELKQQIKQADFDAVLVIRPISERTETEEVAASYAGPYWVPPPGYMNFWPYWHMAWSQPLAVSSSYLKENKVINAQFNLYSTKDEKLLWSGETDTVYSKDFTKLGKEYAKTIVKQLKKDKVIGGK
jgi:hypothetical protein